MLVAKAATRTQALTRGVGVATAGVGDTLRDPQAHRLNGSDHAPSEGLYANSSALYQRDVRLGLLCNHHQGKDDHARQHITYRVHDGDAVGRSLGGDRERGELHHYW